MKLFDSTTLGSLTLQNRMVMAPLTRSRATADHIPTDIMATYYGQRSGAGLIITEGTGPSVNGTGYARIPGLYNDEQVAAWKPVTEAAHAGGAKIFAQIMHTGRVSHPNNMPAGAEVIAPSAVAVNGNMHTDQEGEQPYPTPREMTKADIDHTLQEYVAAAKNAIAAGFDGVELHAANGYLLEQFIYPGSNQRTDEYGGSIENRIRFVLDVAQAVIEAIGKEKVGIRLSPGGAFNDILPYDEIPETYSLLATELGKLGLVYVHLVDHHPMGAPEVPQAVKDVIRTNFGGPIILSGGYDGERAESDLQADKGELIAFGRPFLANPDLPERIKQGAELNQPDFGTFYTPGEKGYTDYPSL
ncbi:MAG TPA: alkene reductase [Cytophagales bacterium]|nr:alkene reductase [Cytophagales bacterium]HAA23930.1 alkene reductase [Cytophagales bacterium]HAP63585.1 alkene reductase [Cytophagales bacterium]